MLLRDGVGQGKLILGTGFSKFRSLKEVAQLWQRKSVTRRVNSCVGVGVCAEKVDEVEAEQQPAFCQGQATHMGACCCQVNKSPTQHPPSCASCLKCYCISFPVAVMGLVFIQQDVSYADFQSDAWSAVPAQTRGDTGVWLGRWGPWRQKDACANRKWFPAVEGWVIQATSLLCAGTGRCLSPAVLAGSWQCCAAHFGTCTHPSVRKSLLLVSHV